MNLYKLKHNTSFPSLAHVMIDSFSSQECGKKLVCSRRRRSSTNVEKLVDQPSLIMLLFRLPTSCPQAIIFGQPPTRLLRFVIETISGSCCRASCSCSKYDTDSNAVSVTMLIRQQSNAKYKVCPYVQCFKLIQHSILVCESVLVFLQSLFVPRSSQFAKSSAFLRSHPGLGLLHLGCDCRHCSSETVRETVASTNHSTLVLFQNVEHFSQILVKQTTVHALLGNRFIQHTVCS